MKVVTYHYVRPSTDTLPNHYYYLALDDFRCQLDYFEKDYNLVSRERFFKMINGSASPAEDDVLLTFDDGLHDHYEWVYPELRSRGVWGVFFASTGAYIIGELLDVHRVHCLLGNVPNEELLGALSDIVTEDMFRDDYKDRFGSVVYQPEQNDAISRFKKILNYFVDSDTRSDLLTELERRYGLHDVDVRDFYATEDELKEMAAEGLTIGSHTVSHRVLSKLSESEQRTELADSRSYLTDEVGIDTVDTFCYPMGREWTFDDVTLDLLERLGYSCAFWINGTDVDSLIETPYTIPRYDCNQFPHGNASGHPR